MTRQTRRQFIKGSALALSSGLISGCYSNSLKSRDTRWQSAVSIDDAIKSVRIPSRVFSVGDFIETEQNNHTQAFADAIDACRSAGGGTVIVPPGDYYTGPIRLFSNIELHISKGAWVKFSTDPADYPMVLTRYEGVELYNYSSLIYAYKATNVVISGEGQLDGQAANENWWSWCGSSKFGWQPGMPRQTEDRIKLFEMAEKGIPIAERQFGQGHYLRPSFIVFYNCENTEIKGVTLRDSPFWNIHPILCRQVRVSGVKIIGHGPNNDGCNPESVNGMVIEDSYFNTGDDCIAIKSGRNGDGRRVDKPSQNIVVRRCQMQDGHGGVVIGSEVSGHVNQVFVEDCVMDSPDLWYAIRIKNNAMRGGKVHGVYIRNVSVGKVKFAAVTCDFNYEEGGLGKYKPEVKDIKIERMVVDNAVRVIDCQGLPNAPIDSVSIRNSIFRGVTKGSIVTHTLNLFLSNVKVNGKQISTVNSLTQFPGETEQ